MKAFYTILFTLLLFACNTISSEEKVKQKQDSIMRHKALLPDAEKRQICKDKVRGPEQYDPDKYMYFEDFYKQYYPFDSLIYDNYKFSTQYYYSANEELINPQKPGNRKWFRLFVQPSFELPFAITLEKQNDYYTLSCKVFGKTYSQVADWTLFSMATRTFNPDEYDMFFNMLDEKKFLDRKANYTNCKFFDPIVFTCEEIDNGKYNKVELALPWYNQCASADDYFIIISAMKLVKDSKIYPVFKQAFPPDRESWINPYEFYELILNTPKQKPTE